MSEASTRGVKWTLPPAGDTRPDRRISSGDAFGCLWSDHCQRPPTRLRAEMDSRLFDSDANDATPVAAEHPLLGPVRSGLAQLGRQLWDGKTLAVQAARS